MQSRKFAVQILDETFYSKKFNKSLPLLQLLTSGDKESNFSRQKLIDIGIKTLNSSVLSFSRDPKSSFSIISVSMNEPGIAKDLADIVLMKLDSLNRFFKIQAVSEKILFIENRIKSVNIDLKNSEQALKAFKEQNRLTSSPSLQLEQDRLSREVQVQKDIYITLKQQLELAKIEEVQETSIVQILDYPTQPLSPASKNLKVKFIFSGIIGFILSIILAYVRSYVFNNTDIHERNKIKRIKSFVNKKSKDFFLDSRVSGILAFTFLVFSPFYFSYTSLSPIYLGRYSLTFLIINILYLFSTIAFTLLYLITKLKNPKKIQ